MSKEWSCKARTQLYGYLLILLSALLSVYWGFALQRGSPFLMSDFKGVYYGAQCLLQGRDPFAPGEVLRVYQAREGGRLLAYEEIRQILTRCVNLPTTFLVVAPFAAMPWEVAKSLWIILNIGCITIAGLLIWDIAARTAPICSLSLVCFLLGNCELIATLGSSAGVVVGLCIISVWCLFTGRLKLIGLACLAISLGIKPHDGGIIWLYFLLAGATYRRFAIKALMVAVALTLVAAGWLTSVGPHWFTEFRSNLATMSMPGGLNDPGPGSITSRTPGLIIDLQAVVAIFKNDPRIYNAVSYGVCGALLFALLLTTARSRTLTERVTWFGLAAAVPLTILICYHRPYDARLLLLSIPGCAMLWAEGGVVGKIAFVINTAAIISTSDFPLTFFIVLTKGIHVDVSSFFGKIVAVVLTEPAPPILLAMAIFYLLVYVHRSDVFGHLEVKQ